MEQMYRDVLYLRSVRDVERIHMEDEHRRETLSKEESSRCDLKNKEEIRTTGFCSWANSGT